MLARPAEHEARVLERRLPRMTEPTENTFPMDIYVDDPAPRPWKFRPTGYLVAILADAEEGRKAEDRRSSRTTRSTRPGETSRIALRVQSSTILRERRSTLGTRVRVEAPCGCASPTSTTSARRWWCSPISSTRMPVTTGTKDRQTSSPRRPFNGETGSQLAPTSAIAISSTPCSGVSVNAASSRKS